MKRIVLALALVIGLSGCAGMQQIFQLATISASNPVTKERLYEVENAAIVIFAGLNAYKQSCIQGLVEKYCRTNIKQIQVYTRQIPPLLAQLRTFVRTEDQVNAAVIYNQLTMLITTVKSNAAANGMPIGGAS